MKTGFIGLGAMGVPMAQSLHRAGLLHAVWNRSAHKARDFSADTGVPACGTVAELAAACEVVVICVAADDDVLAVVDQLGNGLQAGSIVVDCSTVNANTARLAATQLAGKGVEFLDCPVTGGTEGARAATLSILAGGSEAAFASVKPVLEAMGSKVTHMGAVGAGQASKAVNQIMVAGINQAVSEALAFATAEGLSLEKLIDALGQGAAASWFLSHRGPNMAEGHYPLGFKVALHAKDLEICRAMAARFGARLPIVEMTLVHYQRLLDATTEDEDISSLYRLKAALFDPGTG